MAAQAIPDKANEITAIPGLLAQTIAQAIVAQKADYVLALKANHPDLHDDIKLWLDDNDEKGDVRMHETVEKDHRRIETRRTMVSTALDWLAQKHEWGALAHTRSTIHRQHRARPSRLLVGRTGFPARFMAQHLSR